MTKFQNAIIQIVNMIPFGKVVSYGQVALYLGMPRAARQVGWVLRSLEGVDIPWWRVVNNAGRVTIKGNRFNTPEVQSELLRKEGIEVTQLFELNIKKHRFHLPPERWLDLTL